MNKKIIVTFEILLILTGASLIQQAIGKKENINTDESKDIDMREENIENMATHPYLIPGDLVFCEIWDYLVKWFGAFEVKSGFEHIAMYYGKYFGIDWVIEATYLPIPEVRLTPLLLLRLYSKVYYGQVNVANEAIRQKAIDFAENQLGQPYQHLGIIPKDDPFRWHANYNPEDPVDPYSDSWYCAELVWASYYNQGIDLDTVYPENRENNYLEDYGYLRFVSPKNIFENENVTIFNILV